MLTGGRMRQELVEVLERVAAEREIRVVVITGAGRAFCTGGDVDEFASGEVQAISKVVSSERHAMCKAVLAIDTMEKPVLAAVNGIAAGGGCNLALSCDIRIASGRARLSQIFTKRGVHPDWGGDLFLAAAGRVCQGVRAHFHCRDHRCGRGIAHRARQQGGAA